MLALSQARGLRFCGYPERLPSFFSIQKEEPRTRLRIKGLGFRGFMDTGLGFRD